ncbi:hypothetical protein L1987_08575 [Smallanthus sonchifolius]|uniref:Uncharacterized protein n=1 Tax=Smallanthus sonchifolius TaxID=185202 RepID=A0ACB9JKL4_9ASTR|nr:hypothetical protein L1987_08575 [Smallanthus sonchifolius]
MLLEHRRRHGSRGLIGSSLHYTEVMYQLLGDFPTYANTSYGSAGLTGFNTFKTDHRHASLTATVSPSAELCWPKLSGLIIGFSSNSRF